jgi:hypothetical protein
MLSGSGTFGVAGTRHSRRCSDFVEQTGLIWELACRIGNYGDTRSFHTYFRPRPEPGGKSTPDPGTRGREALPLFSQESLHQPVEGLFLG